MVEESRLAGPVQAAEPDSGCLLVAGALVAGAVVARAAVAMTAALAAVAKTRAASAEMVREFGRDE